MTKAKKNGVWCKSIETEGRYRVEAIVTLDERGQMVVPKEIRKKLGVKAGDKLALVTMEKNGKVCCLHLFRTEELADKVRSMVGPLVDEMQEKA